MPITRRRLLADAATITAAGAAAGAVVPDVLSSVAQAESSQSLNFVLIGDWGRAGRDHQRDVAMQMGRTAAAIGSRFTVSLGDNFYENGVQGVDDPQWQSSFEQIYTDASLQSPWKVILGNHDYRGNVPAQIDYSQHSSRWRLPARYFQETELLPDGSKADFFYLDTSPFLRQYIGSTTDISGQDSAAQLTWLDAALGASTAPWKIVIGHHPIYTALDNSDGYEHDQQDLIARLNPILQDHKIPLYICGHDHCLQVVEMAGITYVVNGAGSATYQPNPPIRGGFASGAHGFMTIRLTAAKLDFALIDMQGNTLRAQTLMRA